LAEGGEPHQGDPHLANDCFSNIIDEVRKDYQEIKIKTLNLIFDPLILILMSPIKRFCTHRRVYARSKILE